jgi:acetyl-CoA C-acetyltransferase
MNHNQHSRKNDDVLVIGVGVTPVGEHWDLSLRELALQAIDSARAEAGMLRPQAVYVANMLAPILSGQTQLGALLADFAGLSGVEALTIEAAGASGGMAMRQAYMAVTSGFVEAAMVLGAEKVTDRTGTTVTAALASAADADSEAVQGITQAAQAALLMRRYLHVYEAPGDALAGFSISAHSNAVTNPCAMFRRAIDVESYRRAPIISNPLNMFDAAPVADGAAALILARAEAIPPGTPHAPVRIMGSAAATAELALHDRPDPLLFSAAAESSQRALSQAGVGLEDVDLFELHDVFTICAALSLEACGFAPPGEAWKLARDGDIAIDAKLPILTFGGSKARGDAAGATGVYQLAEIVYQLQGRAGENQVPRPRFGMAQCLGGLGGTAVTHVLCPFEAD